MSKIQGGKKNDNKSETIKKVIYKNENKAL